MGLGTGGGRTYYNVSRGKLINKPRGKDATEGYFYEGKIVGIGIKEDEYEGKPIHKIELQMDDGKEKATIVFNMESWYSWTFFSRIEKVDLSKPVTIGVSASEQNEKMSFCWMKQGGSTIKKDDNFQKPEKKEFGNNVFSDWTPFVAVINPIIEKIKSGFQSIAGSNGEPRFTDDAELPF